LTEYGGQTNMLCYVMLWASVAGQFFRVPSSAVQSL